jgi:hypothetical protein
LWSWHRAHSTLTTEQRAAERGFTRSATYSTRIPRDDAAFLTLHVIAIEAGGQPLLVGGRRQQVARSCQVMNWSSGMLR